LPFVKGTYIYENTTTL